MSRKFRRIARIALIPVVLVGLGSAAAFASGFAGHHGGDHHAMAMAHLDRALDSIDATEDQKTAIQAIVDDAHTQAEELRAEHEALRERGVAVWTAETLDPAAVEAQRIEMLTLADQGSLLASETLIEVGQVLTAEQRAELAELVHSFHERRRGFAGHGADW